ncbi:MAG: molybdopterin-dependent oxidoreductase [Planctomycetes bacterium]|nr:molybdopterin-dependent oxidoreductase [Planctomycetota bacterium]
MAQTKTSYTTCPYNCWPINCGLQVDTHDDGRIEISGNPHHDFSKGRLCVKGQSSFEISNNKDRLTNPLKRNRKSGAFQEISWDQALNQIADKISSNIENNRREATALYHSHGNIVQRVNWKILTPRFANLLGITLWDGNFPCWYDVGVAQQLTGYWGLHDPGPTCEKTAALINWAQDPCASQANLTPYILQVRRNNHKGITIDPRTTQTAAISDLHIKPRLGADVWLANAIAHILITEGTYDQEYVNQYCHGFDQYRQHIMSYPPDQAAKICEISLKEIESLAEIFAHTKPLCINLTRGALGKHLNGIQMVRAILCLIPLSGNVGVEGGGAIWGESIEFNNALCAEEKRPPAPYPVNNFTAIDQALDVGTVNSLIVVGGNPLSQWPNLPKLRRQLEKLDLVVVYDLFMNHTARQAADIILPATSWLEELGFRTSNRRIYIMEKILDPPAQCREAGAWMNDVARRLGIDDYFPWPDKEICLDDCFQSPACHNATIQKLRQHPEGIAADTPRVPYQDHIFKSPTKKFELFSTTAAEFDIPPLPTYTPPLESLADTPELAQKYPLQLISARRNTHFHSFHDSHQVIKTLRTLEPEPTLFMHPKDAAARQLKNGDYAVMFNQRGKGRLRIEITTEVPPRHVSLNDSWPELNEVTATYAPCPTGVTAKYGVGGQPAYQNVLVQVRGDNK